MFTTTVNTMFSRKMGESVRRPVSIRVGISFLMGVGLLGACTESFVDDKLYHASIVELISVPEKYLDSRVAVVGYFSDEYGIALYLSEEYSRANDPTAITIRLSQPAPECVGKYVRVTARFVRDSATHFVVLEELEQLFVPGEWTDCLDPRLLITDS